jgi:N-acetylneuraminate lyase
MNHSLLSGFVAAPYTPFTAEGGLNLERIPALAADLSRHGVQGAFVCGTTGEGSSLTTEERRLVATAWAEAKPARLALVVHVGHNCLNTSLELARHAAAIRADAFAMMAPSFHLPASLADLIESCALVASGAPGLPFYYYHMPEMTGVSFSMRDFLAQAAPRIPNLAGIKFTHENLMDFADALWFDPARFAVLHGRDEILLAGLALGAKGAVGSTYNFAAPLYQRIQRSYNAGDLATAQREQMRAIRMVQVLVRNGGLPAGKAVMKFIGLDCGPTRLPLSGLDDAGEMRLRGELEGVGFFDAIQSPSTTVVRGSRGKVSFAN